MNTQCLNTAESACFDALKQGSGFRFSREVQYSWCARRAVNEGLLTLSVLRDDVRLNLLAAWMKSADTLLDFIAHELPDPSAELEVCRFEQLIRRAHRASASFSAPSFDPQRVLQRSEGAGLAYFQNGPALLVAPGLASFCQIASPHEKRLWARLATPAQAATLMEEGVTHATIAAMLQVGALELAC